MKIFLTGSTGLLGINTVHAALSHGHEVLALARDEGKAQRVLPKDSRLEIVPGDLENPVAWLFRLKEADALMHGAAYFREYFSRGAHDAKLRRVNVELTLELVRAAEEFGLKRSVVVSSSGVVEARVDGAPAGEEDAAGGSLAEIATS
jgi:dihydroflavonol-4-reductase